MNYRETLFFIGKCLTISLEEKNREEIETQLRTTEIDWDAVVKVSTKQFVFPALYCNLKKAKFLHFLPEELVNFMIHITDLNRERNQQIIEQAQEVNQLLISNNITPIFLKGTCNLLEGLYEDIAERMVGDIDFIVSKIDYLKTIKLITENGYLKVHEDRHDFPSHRHYARLHKKNKIAAVEIHKDILTEQYRAEFNYTIIQKDSQKVNNIDVMSFENQFALSIIAKQINDNGFLFKDVALRNAYDVFLLSKKTNAYIAFDKFHELKNPLNCYLASCFEVFNNPDTLQYKSTKQIEAYLDTFNEQLNDSKLSKKRFQMIERKFFIKKRLTILYKSIFDKEHRIWILKLITNSNWQKAKLIQLGLKKSKPNA